MARPKKEKKTLADIIREEYPEFFDEVQALSVEELNTRLATLAKNAEEVEESKENDEELRAAKATASELAAPYRDAKNAIRKKNKFVISLIKDKGGA